jgi:hypothetical protein
MNRPPVTMLTLALLAGGCDGYLDGGVDGRRGACTADAGRRGGRAGQRHGGARRMGASAGQREGGAGRRAASWAIRVNHRPALHAPPPLSYELHQ